ncbi:hypothetical protein B0H16DRAFT_1469689 [Mycena metata]|uniref:Uncharacterized protein n=1 Tax=Mycena metata TaxID=1033252 RepID=A0AAD7HX04_9AGAR|nr:hypothetical protein B0H16DRAFT_1469689 [Mycena metata]
MHAIPSVHGIASRVQGGGRPKSRLAFRTKDFASHYRRAARTRLLGALCAPPARLCIVRRGRGAVRRQRKRKRSSGAEILSHSETVRIGGGRIVVGLPQAFSPPSTPPPLAQPPTTNSLDTPSHQRLASYAQYSSNSGPYQQAAYVQAASELKDKFVSTTAESFIKSCLPYIGSPPQVDYVALSQIALYKNEIKIDVCLMSCRGLTNGEEIFARIFDDIQSAQNVRALRVHPSAYGYDIKYHSLFPPALGIGPHNFFGRLRPHVDGTFDLFLDHFRQHTDRT